MKKSASAQSTIEEPRSAIAERILGAAFRAFLEGGYGPTSMLKIATRARVSKRELYTLFGSKEAILHACISERARRMRPPEPPTPPTTHSELATALTTFGARLLEELTHPNVVGAHRLAVSESAASPQVGQELEAVRRETRQAIGDLLARAQAAGLLAAGDPEAMAGDYMGLLTRDLMVRLMQRVAERPDASEIQARAHAAAVAFLRIYDSD